MRCIVLAALAALALLPVLLPTEASARTCRPDEWPCFETKAVAPKNLARGVSGLPASGLPGSVRAALNDVRSSCGGFRVISTHRRGARVAGTNRRSLHSYGLAADFRVSNYGCAYAVLARHNVGWSRDGRRCRHIHVSDGSSIGRREPAGFRHGRC